MLLFIIDPQVIFMAVTLMIVISTALRFFKRDTSQQIIIQETKAKQLNAELQLFRNQVNPHFLFNTLNNLFSVALKNNDNETAEGISKLSAFLCNAITFSLPNLPMK